MFNPYKQPKFTEPIGAYFPYARLAEAWTPYQQFRTVLNPSEGLFYGTVFPELVRPYVPHPNRPKWY